MEIQEFSPAKAEIQAAILEAEGLTISGVDDEAGYQAVKVARKRLGDMRNDITRFGKGQREEAIKWQKEVLRQEKELLKMIEPTENKLKSELEAIDEAKKVEERKILLPSRIKMLEEVNIALTEDKILAMDENEFSIFFAEAKKQAIEAIEATNAKIAEEQRQAERIEQAKKDAAEKAVIEERERVEREKKAAEMTLQAEEEKEKLEQKKVEMGRKYKAWLKKNGVNEVILHFLNTGKTTDHFIIKVDDTFTLYKKIDTIIL